MANVYVRGYGGVGRLLPRGEFKIPWYVVHLSEKKYPTFGYHSFMRFMDDDDRNKLWDIYEEGGKSALIDAVEYLDETSWLYRYRTQKNDQVRRGRVLVTGEGE